MTYYDETRPSSWITPQLLDFVSGALRGSRMLEVACGTGYWTTRLSPSVSHIDAIDGDTSALRLARQKTYGCPVTFIHHDAFELDQLDRPPFSAAFAADWWSHVRKSRRPEFLDRLHSRLMPGARVVLVDHQPWQTKRDEVFDNEGNRIQTRRTRNGANFNVVKNFPTRADLEQDFAPYSSDFEYYEFRNCGVKASGRWAIAYHCK